MNRFLEITRYEFSMSIRRAGFWIGYILLGLFYFVLILAPSTNGSGDIVLLSQIWPEAGSLVFMYNIFLPLLAGILAADRMQRDFRTGVSELHRSSPLPNSMYILAKYLGTLASVLLPAFAIPLIAGTSQVVSGKAPVEFFWPLLLAILTIAVPAHAFVVAFSLACPLFMPLRVYQVLFTGYWFWGNLISPSAFPTISDTVLNAVGQYPLQAYFGELNSSTRPVTSGFTPPEAVLNLLVLMACTVAALAAIRYYLRWQAKHA